MKTFVASIFFIFGNSAFAQSGIYCWNQDLSGPQVTAQFEINETSSNVELYFPLTATRGEIARGSCQADKMAQDLSMSCSLETSEDTGYLIDLSAVGTTILAKVTPWSLGSLGPSVGLVCAK